MGLTDLGYGAMGSDMRITLLGDGVYGWGLGRGGELWNEGEGARHHGFAGGRPQPGAARVEADAGGCGGLACGGRSERRHRSSENGAALAAGCGGDGLCT